MSETPTVLYHYTSFSALKGILDSRSLWATDICYMNDAVEYRHAVNLVDACIGEVKKGVDAFEREALENLAYMFVEDGAPDVFVFSLSAHHDQLSQWRAYSPGSNVEIGFHKARLEEIAKKSGFGLFPCEYNEDLQNKRIADFVRFSLDVMRANRQRGGMPDIPENMIRRGAFTKEIWPEFKSFAPLFKHHAFSEEAEWRLVSLNEIDSSSKKVRIAHGALVPYYDLSIEEPPLERDQHSPPVKHELPISRITVGSSQDPYLAKRSIPVAFYSLGLRLPVLEVSKVPLRVPGP